MAESSRKKMRRVSQPVTIRLARGFILDFIAIIETFDNFHPEMLRLEVEGKIKVENELQKLHKKTRSAQENS